MFTVGLSCYTSGRRAVLWAITDPSSPPEEKTGQRRSDPKTLGPIRQHAPLLRRLKFHTDRPQCQRRHGAARSPAHRRWGHSTVPPRWVRVWQLLIQLNWHLTCRPASSPLVCTTKHVHTKTRTQGLIAAVFLSATGGKDSGARYLGTGERAWSVDAARHPCLIRDVSAMRKDTLPAHAQTRTNRKCSVPSGGSQTQGLPLRDPHTWPWGKAKPQGQRAGPFPGAGVRRAFGDGR